MTLNELEPHLRRSGMDHTVYLQITPYLVLPRSPNDATTD